MDFDLKQHEEFSGKKLRYFDTEQRELHPVRAGNVDRFGSHVPRRVERSVHGGETRER